MDVPHAERILKQAVRRKIKRFPKDFLFELSMEEWRELITVCDILPETAKYSRVPPDIYEAINFLLMKEKEITEHQGTFVEGEAFGDAGFGQAVVADFLDVHNYGILIKRYNHLTNIC